MPAKRLQAASYSGGESDTEWVAFQTQVKIQKLRKERDQQMAAVIIDAENALKEIKARAVAVHAEQLRAKLKFKSQCVNNICQSLERRQAIEAQMVGLVKDTHAKIKEVEDVIMAGYEGRELEASATSSKT
ncbi:unnamed protein product [Clonostachys rhizophaga]|uniref:Uncharacterized protein n=1 Tax=Clonostachys rhizophaga TaxID=160324 RepID=A0A9N9VRL5_9HYPO|nr:unnamed protein product [Clonostachys rhizophaga]